MTAAAYAVLYIYVYTYTYVCIHICVYIYMYKYLQIHCELTSDSNHKGTALVRDYSGFMWPPKAC